MDSYCPLGRQIGSSIVEATDTSIYVSFDWWGTAEISLRTKTVTSVIRKTGTSLTDLPSNQVFSTYVARDGSLWVSNKGVYQVTHDAGGARFVESGKTEELMNFAVTDILEDHRGQVWVATDGSGLFHYSTATNKAVCVSRIPAMKLPQSNVVMTLHEDWRDKSLWIGTYGDGLYRYDAANKKSQAFERDFNTANNVWDISQDATGNVLASFYGNSLGVFDPKTQAWKHLTVANGSVRTNWIQCVENDPVGSPWIGYVDAGMDRFDESKQVMSNTVAATKEMVNALCFDGDTIWVGSSVGLSLYSRTRKAFINDRLCRFFENTRVADIFKDTESRFWVASARGLFYCRKGDTLPIRSVLDTYFKGYFTKRIAQTSDGYLLFGGQTGLVCVPVTTAHNVGKFDFKVHLTDLRVFGTSRAPRDKHGEPATIDKAREIVLPYDQNYLGLSFSIMDVSHAGEVCYWARVSNFYPEWQPIEMGKNTLELPNMQPCRYQVDIKASLVADETVFDITTVQLTITPPFWRTWWFKISLTLFFVASLTIAVVAKLRAMREENERLERLVSQRTDYLRSAIDNLHETNLVVEIKNEELVESLAMKDKIIGVIGHDFKNPLGTITNILQLLKNKNSTIAAEKFDYLLDLAEQSAQRLSSQMLAVLDWAQGKAGELRCNPVEINLELLLVDTVQLLQENARLKAITITIQANYTTNALVDIRMMSTVLRNLLTNALKFTPRGGSILVMIHEDETMLELSVIDTGVGMPPEIAERLFVDFDRQNVRYGTEAEVGTGLGLQVCKSFVEKNGGTISVKSSEGRGSAFRVLLPKGKTLAKKASFALDGQHDETVCATDDEKKYSVLVVDDNEGLVEILNQTLATNFVVIKAYDGQKALQMARNIMPDVIISDINLPGINGLDLCRTLKGDALSSHIPVILVSGDKTETIETDSFRCGASDFVAKPFNPLSLKHKISALLNHAASKDKPAQEARQTSLFILPESADDAIIKKILEMMNENYGDATYDVDTIASRIGLSRTQLWRKTKSTLGKSPSELISNLRLQKATEMLRSGKYRVSDIAYAVGFSDPRYFSRCFSKEFGLTPTEYVEKKK